MTAQPALLALTNEAQKHFTKQSTLQKESKEKASSTEFASLSLNLGVSGLSLW